jgi:FlaG/FlaF family flagellin (archaellin)
MKIARFFTVLGLLLASVNRAEAAFTVQWINPVGSDGSQLNVAPTVTGSASAGNLVRGPGVSPIASSYAAPNNTQIFNAHQWTNSSTLDTSSYFEFSVSATSGTISLTQLQWTDIRSQQGPTAAEIRTSLDGFTTTLAGSSFSPSETATTHTYNFSPTFTGLTSITIRIYGWNASNSGTNSQYALTNGQGVPNGVPLTIHGENEVGAAPAPATVLAALACLPVLGVVGYLRRRRGMQVVPVA